MVSKIHACLYHTVVQMNLWEFWDVLHGVNRDIWLNIGHTEMKPLCLLHLMVMNLAHGPDETDLRYKQTTDFMNDHYDHSSAEISPCFQEHYPEMIKEFGHLCARQDGESMMQAMWRYCKANSVYKKEGYKTHIARYGAVLAGGKDLLQFWNKILFEAKVQALEGDMVQKKQLDRIRLKCAGADEASQVDSTSANKLSDVDRTLRSCGLNATVCTVAVVGDPKNKRTWAVIVLIPEALLQWAIEANKELRKGVEANQKWLYV